MSKPGIEILTYLRMPARLTAEQSAIRLGMENHDIPVLIGKGMLKPLGNPRQNAPKKFATVEIEKKAGDSAWLSKATKVLSEEWARKKAKRFRGREDDEP